MNQKNPNLITPNISLTWHKKSGDVKMHPSIKKMSNLINGSLGKFLKQGKFVTFKVTYGKAKTKEGIMSWFDNTMITNKISDIKWAYKAFLDRSLWFIQ